MGSAVTAGETSLGGAPSPGSPAITDVREWYGEQLGGPTFTIHGLPVEHCEMPKPEAHYATGNSWRKVVEGVQHCGPVGFYTEFTWVLYVDVYEACGEPHEMGRGAAGLTIMARWDLEGLTDPGPYTVCDREYSGSLGRWRGGLAHELAHAIADVPHPPGCDDGLPSCDTGALMWTGYVNYPDTYFRDDDKEKLLGSPFIRR